MPPRPATNPPWYDSKACFYCFNFTIEIFVIFTYLIGRIDRRFYVPDGSSKVRHYRPRVEMENESGGEKGSDQDLERVVGDGGKYNRNGGVEMNF